MGDDKCGDAQLVQRAEHACQPVFIYRSQYFIETQQVKSFIPFTIAVHQLLHGKYRRQVYPALFTFREFTE